MTLEHAAVLFFWLLVGHSVADYPLQGNFLARAKNHRAPVKAANGQAFPWWIALNAHALIHAGAVALITGVPALGVLEWMAHVAIDYATSDEITGGYVGDQVLHVLCKCVWIVLLLL